MTYPEAIQFLYGLRWFGTKLGLEQTIRLAELAGGPIWRELPAGVYIARITAGDRTASQRLVLTR